MAAAAAAAAATATTAPTMPPLLALHTGSSSMNEREALQVLIVDDSVLIQKMMKKWLEANGCIVSCAINGKIGLDMIKTKQYDIMLLDFLMVSPAFVFLLLDLVFKCVVCVSVCLCVFAACNVGPRCTGAVHEVEDDGLGKRGCISQ
jgi:response regulator RpfG family c-di-GMP phosphodiesterase